MRKRNKTRKIIIGIFLILVIISMLYFVFIYNYPNSLEGESLNKPPPIEDWIKYETPDGVTLEAKFDENNILRGTYRSYSLYKNITSKEEADAVAKEFIELNKNALKVDASSLKLERIQSNTNNTEFNVDYNQYYNNVSVWGGHIWVVIRRNVIVTLQNRLKYNIDISTKQKISKEKAIKIAENSFDSKVVNIEIVILPKDEKYFLAWKIELESPWVIFIDAKNGEIIHKFSLMSPASVRFSGVVTAKVHNNYVKDFDKIGNTSKLEYLYVNLLDDDGLSDTLVGSDETNNVGYYNIEVTDTTIYDEVSDADLYLQVYFEGPQ